MSTVFTSILSTSALIAIFAFVFKHWFLERLRGGIRSEYAKELELYKAKVTAENNVELERFKAQLQIAANDKSIRLSYLA